jgi:glycosyltransferase involved in cell wall biosynthesis
MVREDLEIHLFSPGKKFWDFKELLSLHFNKDFLQNARTLLDKKKISFFYQRYSLNNFSGVYLSKQYRVPFVLEYNGSEIWVSRNWTKPLRYEGLSKRIESLNLKAADVVIVVSQAIKDELVREGIDREKILVNPNGVDPDRYSPAIEGSGVRRRYHLDGKVVIGFIGTFGKWHGAEVLAKAFGLLLRDFPGYREKVRLLMIGDGVTMQSVKENLKDFNATEYAILTGLIPQERGPEYLAACDILVASHKPNVDKTPFFGSPTKLFEYMAMGKGIVASDLDQIGEVLRHDVSAWLVNPGDAASLMQGLKVLIDNGQKRESLGRAARQEVIAKYTWKEHTRKIIQKLEERCG